MNFLAPLFLAGGLAVVGPLIFHLIRRTSKEITPFSSLMFLQPTPPRVTRRSRLENIWLLLLRCAVLALLALGFSRPFVREQTPPEQTGGAGKRLVILLDTSASMRRENLWDAARQAAAEVLRKTQPADEVAIIAFDHAPRTVLGFDEWKALPLEGRQAAVAGRLAALSPGWADTHLDAALVHAAELFIQPAQERPQAGEIIVISDLQDGARLDALQGYEWPKNLTVTLVPVAAHHMANVSAAWLAEADASANRSDKAAPMVRLRVSNSAESRRDQFPLRWESAHADDKATTLNVYVPAGQTRVVEAPKLPLPSPALKPTPSVLAANGTPAISPAASPAANGAAPAVDQPSVLGGALVLSGDDVDFDNRLYVLPPQPARLPVLFLGQDADEDSRSSLYYLRRAFPPTARQIVEITAHRAADAPLAAPLLQGAQLVVLGDGATDVDLAAARELARRGRMVFAPLTTAASAETVAKLLEVPSLTAPEATVKDYALLAQIDFQHPFFAPFADPRFSDFTKIHFWKYRRLDLAALPNARVPARFDNGDPAIVQTPLGKGSVIILTSSWRPVDSQLALSSKFVPFMQILLEQSSNAPLRKAQYFVGDDVPLPSSDQAQTVRKPDGAEVRVAAGGKFSDADQPGIYAVTPGALRFAVNLAPEESRLAPLSQERFVSLGVPINKPVTAAERAQGEKTKVRLQAAELENRQKIWRWLIAAALAALLIETLFASALSRPPSTAAVQT